MKKMIAILIALATTGCIVANGKPEFSESKVAVLKIGDVFKVIYQGPIEATVKISILDANAHTIFTEQITSPGEFIRPYNFSELPKGNYQICVTDQYGDHSEKVCYEDEAQTDYPDRHEMANIVKLRGFGDKYMITIPHQVAEEVEISIYDQDDRMIYSEKQRIDSDFAKVYRLKDLDEATIKVVSQSIKQEKFIKIN